VRRHLARTHLLSPCFGPAAAAAIVGCAGLVSLLAGLSAHRAGPGTLDRLADGAIRSSLSAHAAALSRLALVGDPRSVTAATAAVTLACYLTRRTSGAVLAVVAVPAAGAITELALKPLVGRTIVGALSFPSGHTTGIAALTGVVAVLLIGPQRPSLAASLRWLLAAVGVGLTIVVAVSMVGMGAHHSTDTVAGAAVGAMTVLVTALGVDGLAGARAFERGVQRVRRRWLVSKTRSCKEPPAPE